IVLICIHDQIPLQAALCLRHFIDFYQQAMAHEHSENTIRQMNCSLTLYNKYSSIFEKYSKSRLNFPKNHALWKYAEDIKSHGVVRNYSTNSTELQHKRDAKKPAKRTNFHKNSFTEQVFVFC
ncbi:hypothetical protein INT45_010231, partial [Circinella minor]